MFKTFPQSQTTVFLLLNTFPFQTTPCSDFKENSSSLLPYLRLTVVRSRQYLSSSDFYWRGNSCYQTSLLVSRRNFLPLAPRFEFLSKTNNLSQGENLNIPNFVWNLSAQPPSKDLFCKKKKVGEITLINTLQSLWCNFGQFGCPDPLPQQLPKLLVGCILMRIQLSCDAWYNQN